MADEWNPEDDEDWRKHPDPWRNFLDAAERTNLPSGRPVVRSAAGSSVIPRSTALVPYKDPTKFNITLPGSDLNKPAEGFSAENRRRWARQWGGSSKGIGGYLRMLGARSPIGRIAQGVLGVGTKVWNELPEEDKEKFLNFMRQPLTDKSGLEYLQEIFDPQPEQKVSGALPYHSKYEPRLEKFITNLPQRVWTDRTSYNKGSNTRHQQLRNLFAKAVREGKISEDELYYGGGGGLRRASPGALYDIEARSLGEFLDHVGVGMRNYNWDEFPEYETITKDKLLEIVRRNPLGITEREFSDDYEGPTDPSKSLTYPPSTRWTMKGGRNYKETLLNLSDVKDDETRNQMSRILHSDREGETLANNLGWIRHHTRDIYPDKGGSEYVDRLRDKNHSPLQTTQLDEAQTDVRRLEGFPLKDKFMEIAAHRLIRQAIEDGSDYITWTSGDEQARRNNQAFYINSVNVRNEPGFVDEYGKERPWRVSGGHYNGETDQMMGQLRYADDELNEAFGKKWADKIRRDATKQTSTIWSGSPPDHTKPPQASYDAQSEGSLPQEVYSPGGVRKLRLYNNNDLKGKMVNIFNKIGKKFGTKVEWKRGYPSTGQVDSGDDLLRSPAVKITPELIKFYSTAPIKLAQGGLVDKPLYEDSGTRYG